MLFDALAVLDQEESTPALRIVELLPLVDRRAGRLGDIRHEIAGVSGECGERLGAYFVRRLIERVEPGIVPALEELDRRQSREQHERRLRPVERAPAQQRLQARGEAVE